MKRRDWLVQQGLAKPGRGKFSAAAQEALNKAKSEGVKFSDWPDDKPNTTTGTPRAAAKPVVKKEATVVTSDPGNTPYLFPDEYRFPESEYVAYRHENGKRVPVSLREVCNTCRVSLVNHACDNPTIHGNLSVTIKGKG